MTTAELQAEIKILLHRLGWSQEQAAEQLYYEQTPEQDWDGDDAARRRFCESFRKKLSRPTTKPAWLEEQLAILSRQPEARRLSPARRPRSPLPPALLDAIRAIGRERAQSLRDEEDACP